MNLTKNYGIVPNGSRTSSSMNDALEEMYYNISNVNDRVYTMNEEMTRFMKRTLLQQQALSTIASGLSYDLSLNTMDSILLSAYDLVDNSQYVIDPPTSNSESTITHWREYGLITPKITELPNNQFTVADKNGVRWVPKTTRLQYAAGIAIAENPDTGETGWSDETDPAKISAAFDEKGTTAWFVDLSAFEVTDTLEIWIKATLPAEYLYQTTANTVVIHPEPMFGAKLLGAWYNSDHTPLMPYDNYIPEGGRSAVNEMFLVGAERIESVTFHFQLPAGVGTKDSRALYISHIGVYNTQFEATGELNLKLNGLSSDITLATSGHTVNSQSDSPTTEPLPFADVSTNTLSITLNRNEYGEVPDTVRDIVCKVT